MKKAVICDLDNTLFNSRNPDKYLPTDKKDPKQWQEYNKHYKEVCKINCAIANIIRAYIKSDFVILFITARERTEEVIKETLEQIRWFKRLFDIHQETIGEVIFRPVGDMRPCVEIKKQAYEQEIANKYDIVLAIDDDKTIVDLWRSYNIPTMHFYQTEVKEHVSV